MIPGLHIHIYGQVTHPLAYTLVYSYIHYSTLCTREHTGALVFPGADLDPLTRPTRNGPHSGMDVHSDYRWLHFQLLLFPQGTEKLVSDEGTLEDKRESRQMAGINRTTNLKRRSKVDMCLPYYKYLKRFEGEKICLGSPIPSTINCPITAGLG